MSRVKHLNSLPNSSSRDLLGHFSPPEKVTNKTPSSGRLEEAGISQWWFQWFLWMFIPIPGQTIQIRVETSIGLHSNLFDLFLVSQWQNMVNIILREDGTLQAMPFHIICGAIPLNMVIQSWEWQILEHQIIANWTHANPPFVVFRAFLPPFLCIFACCMPLFDVVVGTHYPKCIGTQLQSASFESGDA